MHDQSSTSTGGSWHLPGLLSTVWSHWLVIIPWFIPSPAAFALNFGTLTVWGEGYLHFLELLCIVLCLFPQGLLRPFEESAWPAWWSSCFLPWSSGWQCQMRKKVNLSILLLVPKVEAMENSIRTPQKPRGGNRPAWRDFLSGVYQWIYVYHC